MATWVAHFRLVESLLKQGFALDRRMFLVGNIAPDSGILKADKSGYEPPSDVSHWRGDGPDILPEQFYADHLAGKTFEAEEYAFRMGYYCHLIADQLWAEMIWRPKKATPLYAPLQEDPQFAWEIKKDWYGLDFLYLQANPQSIFYTDFVHIQAVPDYIDDVFPADAFTRRVQDTQGFYLNPPDWDLDRPYEYLNRQEWDDYIAHTFTALEDALTQKGITKH